MVDIVNAIETQNCRASPRRKPEVAPIKEARESQVNDVPLKQILCKPADQTSVEDRTLPNPAPPIKQVVRSEAEDPKLIEEVIGLLIKGRWNAIAPAHILAVSPVIRAKVINYLWGHKVEVNHLLDRASVMNESNKIVGHISLPVREVEVELPRNIKTMGGFRRWF